MTELPRGTVSFLFTDVEASTRLWQDHARAMPAAYARHDAILRTAVATHGGVVYKVVGDAMQAAFASAPEAVAAAIDAQQGLLTEDWAATGLTEPLRVRMALHTVAVAPDADGDYRTPGLNRLGRLLATAAGGQILLSGVTADLAHDHLPPGGTLRDLGPQRLKDIYRPEHVYELVASATGDAQTPSAALPGEWSTRGINRIGRVRAAAVVAGLVGIIAVLVYLASTDRPFGRGDSGNPAAAPDSGPGRVLLDVTVEGVPVAPAYLGMGYLEFGAFLTGPDQPPPTNSFPGPIALYCVCSQMISLAQREDIETEYVPPTIWSREPMLVTYAPISAGEAARTERTAPGAYVSMHPGDQVVIPANSPFSVREGSIREPGGEMGDPASFVVVGIFPLPAPSPLVFREHHSDTFFFPEWLWRSGGVMASLPNGSAHVSLRRVRLEPGDSIGLDGTGPVLLLNEGFASFVGDVESNPANLTLAIAQGGATITHPPDYQEPPNETPVENAPPQITVVVRPDTQATPGGETLLPGSQGAALDAGTTGSVRNNGPAPINLLFLTVLPAKSVSTG